MLRQQSVYPNVQLLRTCWVVNGPTPLQTRFNRVACDLAFDSWGTPWFIAWTGAACSGVFYYNNATGAATQVRRLLLDLIGGSLPAWGAAGTFAAAADRWQEGRRFARVPAELLEAAPN